MRILSLIVLFTASFYFFLPERPSENEIDILKVKISAPAREVKPQMPVKKTQIAPVVAVSERKEIDQQSTSFSYYQEEGFLSEAAEVEHFADDDGTSAEEVEAGWNHELRESLAFLEPEYAEDIFHAYESEKNSYQAEFDLLIKEHQKNHNLDFMISDLELRHEERLKEIFGRHYEEIKALRASYIEYRTSSN